MAKQLEQIAPHSRPGKAKRFLKKLANKIMRRAAKADPETAPKRKRFMGYNT